VVLANVDAVPEEIFGDAQGPVFQGIADFSSGSKFSQTATQIGTEDIASLQFIQNFADDSQGVQRSNVIAATDDIDTIIDVEQEILNEENGSGSTFVQEVDQIGTENSFSSQSVNNDASNTDNSQTQLILGSTDTEVVQDIENNQVGGEDAVNIQDGELIQF
jgi:hypothetical protein